MVQNTLKRSTAGLSVILAAGLALSACAIGASAPAGSVAAGDPSSPEQTAVTVSAMLGPASAPLWAAAETGIAEGYGLELTPSWVGNSGIAVTSVVSGDSAAASTSYFGVIDAINQGMDLVVVNESYSGTPGTGSMETLPGSGITEVADLIGHKTNVISLNSSHIIKLNEQLLDAGLDPSKVEWVELPYGEVAAALEQGSIAASSAVGPAYAAVKNKLDSVTVFDYGAGRYEGLAEAGFVMKRSFLEKNPNTAAALQCTIVDANNALLNDRSLYERFLVEAVGMSPEAAAADTMMTFEPGLRLDSIQANADLYLKTGRVSKAFDFEPSLLPLPENC